LLFFIAKPNTLERNTTMSLKPSAAAVDPPPHGEDRRGDTGSTTDLPRFKDQVSPPAVAAGPHPFKHQQVGRILTEEVPLAEATPVSAISSSYPITTTNRIGERPLEPEGERLANLQPQQQREAHQLVLEREREREANLPQNGRPPAAPSETTGSAATCSCPSQQKKLWIALGIILIVVVVVVVAVVITLVLAGGPETPGVPVDGKVPTPAPVVPSAVPPTATSPVPPPQSEERREIILPYINSITLSSQTLSYPPSTGTAEERAVQWLIEDDVNTATADSDALRQRYVLSTLWFIPTPAPFGTGDGSHAGTWITKLNVCEWRDVACDVDGWVTALSLSEKNVRGRIPNDMGLLTAMTSLQLWGKIR
jgi:hypothetical protein